MRKASLIILPLCLSLAACQFESSTGTPATPPAVPASEGNSSGGGGFGDESSMQLLKWSQQIVTRGIRQANTHIFKNLPQGWNPERLAALVENIRPQPNKVVYRYNRELMFDYVVPKEGEPYLIATSLFFRAFASVPVTGMPPDTLEPYLREIRNRLLHETAHVLGIGTSETSDYKARVFATHLVQVLWQNNVICEAKDVPENYPSKVQEWDIEQTVSKLSPQTATEDQKKQMRTEIDQQSYYWMVNRPFGFGLQTRKFYEKVRRSNFFISALLAGNPAYGTKFYSFPQQLKGPDIGIHMEPVRFYEPAYFFVDEQRVHQQYYKLVENKDGWMRLQGRFSQQPSSATPNIKACEASETFRIPQNLSGAYAGAIEFSDNCGFETNEKVSGEIQVKCMESFVAIKNLKEFYGESAFQDAELISITPDGSLD